MILVPLGSTNIRNFYPTFEFRIRIRVQTSWGMGFFLQGGP